MVMKVKITWIAIILGASAMTACAPVSQVLPSQAQAARPPVTAKPAPAPQAPAPVSRTLPLPKEPAPKVEVLQHRQDQGIADDAQEPEVLEVDKVKKYDSSPAARALVKQADTEIGQGKLAAATATIERALRIEPENPDLWLKLSELHKRQGDDEQASSMATKAEYYQEQLN